jgi:hypothetical protein
MNLNQEIFMNISGNTANSSTTHQSILKSANKQPELALQLLQKSLEGEGTLQTNKPSSEAASSAVLQNQSLIDIRA